MFGFIFLKHISGKIIKFVLCKKKSFFLWLGLVGFGGVLAHVLMFFFLAVGA
jgi:hypothetical protein